MIRNMIALIGFAVVARAAIIATPSATAVAVNHPSATFIRADPYNTNPHYSYSYSISDGHTGDNKAQSESRNGDIVQGSYSLVEPDGSRRTVSYEADSINGFNAIVQQDPQQNLHSHPVLTSNPILRTAAIAHPAQIVTHHPVLTATRSDKIVATANANANFIRQSSVIHNASPYVTSQLVGVRIGGASDSAYERQSAIGNIGHGYGTTDFLRVD